jgi:hypothetical protein
MGMSVWIPASLATTHSTAPGGSARMARAVSTMGYGQSVPEVSIVRSGGGRPAGAEEGLATCGI